MTTKTAQQLTKVMPSISNITAILEQQHVQGPMLQYSKSRMSGHEITPDMAKAAYIEAKNHVDTANAKGMKDVELSPTQRISTGILQGLMYDISNHVKQAASLENMIKLADKFENSIKK
jgi:hypothetical protein